MKTPNATIDASTLEQLRKFREELKSPEYGNDTWAWEHIGGMKYLLDKLFAQIEAQQKSSR